MENGRTCLDSMRKTGLLFCSLLMLLVPVPGAALDITVLNPTKVIKRDLGPLMTLSTPYTTIKTPITISSFPPGWEHGKIHALAVVYFFETSGSSTEDIVGYGSAKKIIPLTGQSTVSLQVNLPVHELGGKTSSSAFAYTLAILRRNDECIVLGVATAGDAHGLDLSHMEDAAGNIGPCDGLFQ
jgi:hypothetical protein